MHAAHDGQGVALMHALQGVVQHQQGACAHQLAGHAQPPLHARIQVVCRMQHVCVSWQGLAALMAVQD